MLGDFRITQAEPACSLAVFQLLWTTTAHTQQDLAPSYYFSPDPVP